MANVGDIVVKMSLKHQQLVSGLSDINRRALKTASQLKRMGSVSTAIGRTMSFALTAPIAGMAAAGLNAQIKFDKNMRNVNVVAKQTEEQFQMTRSAALDLAREMGQSPREMADALYNISSASFLAGDGLTVLKESSILARGGLATVNDSAKAVTAVLNAYGKGAEEAADVSDIFLKTVERGVTTLPELVQHLGGTAGTASALKIPFEQVAAAVATMTRGGIDTAESFTALNRFMLRFIQASPELNAIMKATGIESAEAMFKTRGLAGAVDWLNQVTAGSPQLLSDLGFMTRDLKAAMKLTGDQSGEYAEDLDTIAIKSNRAGASQAALIEQQKTVAFTIEKIKVTLETGLIRIMDSYDDEINTVLASITKLVDKFANMNQEQRNNVAKWAMILAAIGPVLILFGSGTKLIANLIIVVSSLSTWMATASVKATIFATSLKGVGVAASLVGAALAGWSIGRFISQLEIGGKSIEDHIANAFTKQPYIDEGTAASFAKGEAARRKNRERWAKAEAEALAREQAKIAHLLETTTTSTDTSGLQSMIDSLKTPKKKKKKKKKEAGDLGSGLAGAMLRGSAEAFSTINRKSQTDRALRSQEDTADNTKGISKDSAEMVTLLEKVLSNLSVNSGTPVTIAP